MLPAVPTGRTPPFGIVSAWLEAKRERTRVEKREKALHQEVSALVEAHGHEDDKGNVWLRLPANVTGWDGEGRRKTYNAVQRQRRVSLQLDEAAALERLAGLDVFRTYVEVTDTERALVALAEAGLLDGAFGIDVIVKVDDDKLQAAYFSGRIPQEDYDAVVTRRVTWALLPGRM